MWESGYRKESNKVCIWRPHAKRPVTDMVMPNLNDRWWVQSRGPLQDCTSISSFHKAYEHLEQQEILSWFQNMAATNSETLVMQVLLCACETWILTTDLQKQIRASEMSAITRSCTPPTKTILPEEVCSRNEKPLVHFKTCWQMPGKESSGGIGRATLPSHLVLQRTSCRALHQVDKEKAGRERGGRITSTSG